MIYWAGDVNRAGFEESLTEAARAYAGQSTHGYWLVGSKPKNMSVEKSEAEIEKLPDTEMTPVNPPDGIKDLSALKANTDGLKSAVASIQAQVEALKKQNPNLKNSDFEIDTVISNHGTLIVEPNPAVIGPAKTHLSQDPRASGPNLTPDLLTEIFSTLPPGMRFKSVTGNCMGASFSEAIQRGIKPSCSCRSDLATNENSSLYVSDSDTKQSVWLHEGQVFKNLAQTPDLLSAHWRSGSQGRTGQSSERGGPGSQIIENALLTSSEKYLYDYFNRSPDPTLPKLTTDELESRAEEIYPDHPQPSINADQRKIWQESEATRQRLIVEMLALKPPEKSAELTKDFSPARLAQQKILDRYKAEYEEVKVKIDEIENRTEKPIKIFNDFANLLNRMSSQERREQTGETRAAQKKLLKIYKERVEKAQHEMKIARQPLLDRAEQIARVYNLPQENLQMAVKLQARRKLEEGFLSTASEADKENFFALRACELQPLIAPLAKALLVEESKNSSDAQSSPHSADEKPSPAAPNTKN